jgi:hypothetical protein
MSADPESLRLDDRPAATAPAGELDLGGLAGGWLNTDGGDSGGVLRFDLAERDGRLYVAATAVGEYDWNEVEAVPFAPSAGADHAWAFNCRFEFDGGVATEVSAYNKQGILVAAIFTSFEDDSPRADYWTREFFHREELR